MARFNNLAVAGSAESRDIADAMEQKISQAMSMLTSQIAAQLNTIGNDSGEYYG